MSTGLETVARTKYMLLPVIHHGKSAFVQFVPARIHTVVRIIPAAMRLVSSWELRGTHGVLPGCTAAYPLRATRVRHCDK